MDTNIVAPSPQRTPTDRFKPRIKLMSLIRFVLVILDKIQNIRVIRAIRGPSVLLCVHSPSAPERWRGRVAFALSEILFESSIHRV